MRRILQAFAALACAWTTSVQAEDLRILYAESIDFRMPAASPGVSQKLSGPITVSAYGRQFDLDPERAERVGSARLR